MNTQEIATKLREAAALVDKGWTQGTNARDAERNPVASTDKRAVCFCAFGALRRATDDNFATALAVEHANQQVRLEFGDAFTERFRPSDAVNFNDEPGRTKEEVSALLRRTADRLDTGTVLI